MKVSIISPLSLEDHKEIPLFLHAVQAGFPSPADDYVETAINLNDLLGVNDASTFFVHVVGQSMDKEGIMHGDILPVRKDVEPKNGDIVIAAIDGDFTVKRYRKTGNRVVFEAANDDFQDIVPEEMQDVQIWGVVTGMIRSFKRSH